MGNVKIADFGSGKKMQSLASQQGAFHSTIHYTAPEVSRVVSQTSPLYTPLATWLFQVLLGKTAYGRKADVWSVGVTLVEMLTGKVPWKEFEPMAAMFQIAYEEPRLDVSSCLRGLVGRLEYYPTTKIVLLFSYRQRSTRLRRICAGC